MKVNIRKIIGYVLLLNVLPMIIVIGERFFTPKSDLTIIQSYLYGLGADALIAVSMFLLVFIFSLIND